MRSYEPSLGALLAGNIGAETQRVALVEHGVQARVVVPTAGISESRARALARPGEGSSGSFPVRDGNAVEYFINQDALVALKEGLDTARAAPAAPGHASPSPFVLLIGWNIAPETRIPGSSVRFGDALVEVARRGVPVFVLMWASDSPFQGYEDIERPLSNEGATERFAPPYLAENRGWLDNLEAMARHAPNLHVRRDARTHRFGSHHQKLMIVQGTEGLVAFYGGVDVAPNRLEGYFDVHARVRGPAALDLYRLAYDRWSTSSSQTNMVGGFAGPLQLAERLMTGAAAAMQLTAAPPDPPSSVPHAGHSVVRVAQTAGHGEMHALHPHNDIAPMIIAAIGRARRFVYMEDQYFGSAAIADSLAAALPHVSQVILLLTRAFVENAAHRQNALRRLAVAARQHPGKVGVFIRDGGQPRWYVHSKVCIVDDELAIVGSCNLNRRGFEVDSEVMVAQAHRIDPAWSSLDLPRPHKLRMQLWHRHLNADVNELAFSSGDYERSHVPAWRLLDPIASSVYWMSVDRDVLAGTTTESTRSWGRVVAYHLATPERPHWSQAQLYEEAEITTEAHLGMEARLT